MVDNIISRNMNEEMASYIIYGIILVVAIGMIIYVMHISRLRQSNCNYMDSMYQTLNGNIRPINPNDPNCRYKFNEYFIKTAYNACSGGNYKNGFVDICNLKNVLKQGVRGLDFEIYSIDNKPCVATSTIDSYYVKETYNYVKFIDVMEIIKNYAFSGSTAPNNTDPIILHFRFMSNNQKMYDNMSNILKSYDTMLMGKEYSYESYGKNFGDIRLLDLMNKVVIIADRSNTAFLENEKLMEYINLTSGSVFMRALPYFDVKNNPDLNELREYNKKNMTIVFPDKGINPPNPSGILCRESGCQMVAMRYQYVDDFLNENNYFFDEAAYAFVLKPERLRYKAVEIKPPTPQNPQFSYQTRNFSTDYYSFKI
jgi:hypothetical protein